VSINEDSKGRLWVGSTLGIKLYDKTPHGLEPVLSAAGHQNSLFAKAPPGTSWKMTKPSYLDHHQQWPVPVLKNDTIHQSVRSNR
jgi:ligand-binding sensor domain-containing protein